MIVSTVRRRAAWQATLVAVSVVLAAPASAQSVTLRVKAATGTVLSSGTSWTGGTAPISTTGGQWTSTSLGGALTLATSSTWGLIDVQGATSDISLSGSQLTIASGSLGGLASTGINLPTAAGVDVTIGNNVNIAGGQGWKVFTGRTLTMTGTISGADTNTFTMIARDGGTLVLTGNNTFLNSSTTSWMRIDGSTTVRVNAVANGGVASPLGQASSDARRLLLNGGVIDYVGTGHSTNRLFSMSGNSTIAANGSGVLNYTSTGTIAYRTTTWSAGSSQFGAGAGRVLTLGGTSTADNTFRPILIDGTTASGLTKSGSGMWIVSGSNTFTGTTTVSGGVLVATSTAAVPGWDTTSRWSVASGAALGVGNAFTDANIATLLGTGNFASGAALGFSTATADRTYGTAIADTSAGPLGLVKSQANTLTLSASNAYTGGTTIMGGRLLVENPNALGSSSAGLAVMSGTLDLGSHSLTVGRLGGEAGGLITTGSAATVQLIVSTSGTATYAGRITSGSGTLGLVKSDSGRLVLSGSNSFGGGTTLNAGSVELDHVNALGTGTVSFAGTATALMGVSGTIANPFSIAAAVLGTFDTAGQNAVLSGLVDGAGGLTKTGAGSLRLAGVGSYAGATGVTSGSFVVDGSLTSSAVTVNSGASLMGSGSIGGATAIAGVHSPGNSPGLQTFTGGLEYTSTGALVWELFANTAIGRGTTYDGVDVTGGSLLIDPAATLELDFGTTALGSSVDWDDAFWGSDHQWTIIDIAGGATWNGDPFRNLVVGSDTFGRSLTSVRPDSTFSVADVDGNVTLVYVIVPEPGAIALAGIGLAVVGWSARRRRGGRHASA